MKVKAQKEEEEDYSYLFPDGDKTKMVEIRKG